MRRDPRLPSFLTEDVDGKSVVREPALRAIRPWMIDNRPQSYANCHPGLCRVDCYRMANRLQDFHPPLSAAKISSVSLTDRLISSRSWRTVSLVNPRSRKNRGRSSAL